MQPLTLHDLEMPLDKLSDASSCAEQTLADVGRLFHATPQQRQQLELAADLIEAAQAALRLAVA